LLVILLRIYSKVLETIEGVRVESGIDQCAFEGISSREKEECF
jgi:hypothetical protein